jgi:glyoxylase-like metal-dependent hydrolase (beta-lactamase superfamily II)
MVPIFQAQDTLPDQLATLGLSGDDIDVVVNSHFHPDHCGCNEYFRKATVVCHRRELEAARAGDADQLGYQRADWDHAQQFQPIDGTHDLFGDSRITLIPAPGHTPGCLVAHVQLEHCGNFLLASDTVPMRVHLEQDELPRNTWNNELAAQSIGEIRHIERGGATVVFGHDAEQWQALRKGGDAYD